MESQENATQNALTEQVADAVPAEQQVVNTDEQAAPNAESAPAEQPAPAEQEEEKQSKVVKELISQRKRRQQAEQEAAYWKGRAEASGVTETPKSTQSQPVQPTQQVQQEPQPPSIDKYDTYEEYERAKDEYLIQKAEFRVRQQLINDQRKQQVEQVQNSFRAKMDAAANVDPTIYETVEEVGKMVSPLIAEIVVQSEQGIELTRYFKQNPQEAQRLSQMHPLIAAKEMGKLEAKLSTPVQTEPPKKVSAAPNPIPTVTPAGSTVIDEDNLPIEEYHKRRTKALYGR